MKALKIIYGLGIGYLIYQTISSLLALIFSGAESWSSGLANGWFALNFCCGLAAATLGLLLFKKLRVFSLGLLVGGLLLLISQSGIYTSWSSMLSFSSDYYSNGGAYFWTPLWGRFLSLLVALVVLGIAGYTQFYLRRGYSEPSEDESEITESPSTTALKVVYGLGTGLMILILVVMGILTVIEPSFYDFESNTGISTLITSSICGLASSIVGLVLPKRFNAMRIGLLVGGILTLVFGAIASLILGVHVAGSFVASLIFLIVLGIIGYVTLARSTER